MSLFSSFKDVMVGQAMKLASNPKLTKIVTDPRVMNAAMKAMSLGGSLKSSVDKCGKLAAGTFGLVTQEQVAELRTTIQTLEDTVAALEAKAAAGAATSPAGSTSASSAAR